MCGICGKLYFDPARPAEPEVLARMTEAIRHRGPDDGGTYLAGPVGLGNRRLAILDLSPLGHQPMANEDGTCWITFNGEIYNFQELRPDLEARGHRFRSQSDTEVILHLYEERGEACVEALRGMFAFAIWDGRTRTLFLARDRLGKKPLYYYADPTVFLFASEAKAILADPRVEARPDPEALDHYLTYQYVPAPLSAFRGLRKLPPGHTLRVADGRVVVRRYWRLRYTPKRAIPEAEAAEAILEHLTEAVRLRLISDVPLGAFLSGGIDSSLVVALMSRMGPGPVRTFSIGFEEEAYNELPYARMVAERFGTEHHEFVVRPDALAVLPKLAWHYDEPFADSSAIPTYDVARMTRQFVTVALTGDAGDENFAGYDRYAANQVAARVDGLPAPLRRGLVAAGRLATAPGWPRRLSARARRFLDGLAAGPPERYARWICHFDEPAKRELCAPDFLAQARGRDPLALLRAPYAESDAPDLVDATLHADVETYLPGALLTKVDIASMANSLEARSPFLDHVLMEYVASLPSHLKLRGGVKKYILKRAARGVLPDPVIHRPKQGFGVPIDRWFRHELREMAHDILLDPKALGRGYFRRAGVEQLLDDHCRRGRDRHYQLWNLLMLELWHRTFIDERHPSVPLGGDHR